MRVLLGGLGRGEFDRRSRLAVFARAARPVSCWAP